MESVDPFLKVAKGGSGIMQIGLEETESRDSGQFSPFVRRRQLSREDHPDSGRGGWTEE